MSSSFQAQKRHQTCRSGICWRLEKVSKEAKRGTFRGLSLLRRRHRIERAPFVVVAECFCRLLVLLCVLSCVVSCTMAHRDGSPLRSSFRCGCRRSWRIVNTNRDSNSNNDGPMHSANNLAGSSIHSLICRAFKTAKTISPRKRSRWRHNGGRW